MKKSFLTTLILLNVAFSFGQRNSWWIDSKFNEQCANFLNTDLPEDTSFLNGLRTLNIVTLGDYGEAMYPEKYLASFKNMITSFSSNFNDSALIKLTSSEYCPLIRAYSFSALATRNDTKSQNDCFSILKTLAKDTTSLIFLDHGCYEEKIQLFDYCLSLMTGRYYESYYVTIDKFDKYKITEILEVRKEFFTGKDIRNDDVSWDEYCRYYNIQ